jgi:hypothetical protein
MKTIIPQSSSEGAKPAKSSQAFLRVSPRLRVTDPEKVSRGAAEKRGGGGREGEGEGEREREWLAP